MPRVILFFLLSINFSATAQIIKEYYDDNSLKKEGELKYGERQGLWREYYSNGELKSEGSYDNGAIDGEWVYFCEHGVKERLVKWKYGKCIGIITFSPFGYPYLHMNFAEGISQERYIDYLKIVLWGKMNQKRLLLENDVDVSMMHQRYIRYTIPRSYQFMFGINTPLSLNYVDSMNLFEDLRNEYLVAFCKSLNKEFEYSIYYGEERLGKLIKRDSDNCLLKIESEFYSMEPYGEFKKTVYINDTLSYEIEYIKNGKNYQVCKEYFKNGQIRQEGKMDNGKREKAWKFYNEKGILQSKKFYEEDVLKKTKTY